MKAGDKLTRLLGEMESIVDKLNSEANNCTNRAGAFSADCELLLIREKIRLLNGLLDKYAK